MSPSTSQIGTPSRAGPSKGPRIPCWDKLVGKIPKTEETRTVACIKRGAGGKATRISQPALMWVFHQPYRPHFAKEAEKTSRNYNSQTNTRI